MRKPFPKVATVHDNAVVKTDLSIVKLAIKNGKLDDVFTLTTFDYADRQNKTGLIQ